METGWHHPSFSHKQIIFFVVLSSEQHVNLPSAHTTSPSHMDRLTANQSILMSANHGHAIVVRCPFHPRVNSLSSSH
ncbi:hypothetical protein BJV74DRAFT_855510, partial [Russula compacta]